MGKLVLSTILLACCFVAIFQQAVSQFQSFRIPSDDETCNVVNLNFGAAGVSKQPTEPRQPGPPGKRGGIGPIGRNGQKGAKGEFGQKGESGEEIDGTELKNGILGILGVSSCKELQTNYGISNPGYYLMRSRESAHPMYVYCPFKIHEGVTSCLDVQTKYGVTESGIYSVRPDSSSEAFDVFCNYASGEAITEIWHDSMHEIREPDARCPGQPACKAHVPQYDVSSEDILKVTTKSKECRQYLKVRCIQLAFSSSSWWISRDDEKMKYWGGTTKEGYCACGVTATCINKLKKCNCDLNNGTLTEDYGYLTDKTKLPVKEMWFGDLDDAVEHVWHTLGKLECMGQA